MTLDTTNLRKRDLESKVLKIHVSAAPATPESATPLLHWCLVAVLGKKRSVVFDPRPRGSTRSGCLDVSSQKCALPETSLVHFSFEMAKFTDIEDIIDLLVLNDREEYVYAHEGAGCRYWAKVAVSDLERVGRIAEGSSLNFMMRISQLSSSNRDLVPMMEAEGTFK